MAKNKEDIFYTSCKHISYILQQTADRKTNREWVKVVGCWPFGQSPFSQRTLRLFTYYAAGKWTFHRTFDIFSFLVISRPLIVSDDSNLANALQCKHFIQVFDTTFTLNPFYSINAARSTKRNNNVKLKQLKRMNQFNSQTSHVFLVEISVFTVYFVFISSPNTAQWLCRIPLNDVKQLLTKWEVDGDRHVSRVTWFLREAVGLRAVGLQPPGRPLLHERRPTKDWQRGNTGEASTVASLSLPPGNPAWNRHTLLQQPTIAVAKLLQTPRNIRNTSAVSQIFQTLLLCGFLLDCTFLLQAIISAAAAAESQLDLRGDSILKETTGEATEDFI